MKIFICRDGGGECKQTVKRTNLSLQNSSKFGIMTKNEVDTDVFFVPRVKERNKNHEKETFRYPCCYLGRAHDGIHDCHFDPRNECRRGRCESSDLL